MMQAEKSHTAIQIIEKISATAPKVGFLKDGVLADAFSTLENRGIPNNKNEDYKYCNIDAILKKDFKNISQQFSSVVDISGYRLEDTVTLVVLNGNFSPELSDKIILQGLHLSAFSNLGAAESKNITSLANVKNDAFVALNTAFSGEGFYLNIERNAEIRIPLHILYITTAEGESLVNPRSFVFVGENASVTLIEEQVHMGTAKTFSNLLSEKFIDANASLTNFIFQNEGGLGYCVNTQQVRLHENSRYTATTISLGGKLIRNNHNVELQGKNAEANLFGLFAADAEQLIDNHTLVDHQVPHCESNELYKGLAAGKSTGVFNGKIFVRQDAQKTNAYQSSKNILLSNDASINTKPQLEIYADDVKCSHGTSTGKIDENALFYLNARGIGRESAKKMLLASFADEIISKVEVDSLRDKISSLFENTI